MRVVVLSLIEATGAEPGGLRGYLPIGGRSLLRHQIGLALSLGARRIVVMAEGISGELVALQHVAEAGGRSSMSWQRPARSCRCCHLKTTSSFLATDCSPCRKPCAS